MANLVERLEFDQRTKDKAWFKAEGKCRSCGVKIAPGKEEYDHILPAALGGKATLANCQVMCEPCHGGKTKQDINRIRKSDRQRRYHNGTKAAPKQKLESAPMPKAEPQRKATKPLAKQSLPPRPIYRSAI
jgi:5-methylcytosine-specific restriction endonuclease McrA